EYLHGCLNIRDRRKGGSQPDVTVGRIFAVGPGGSSRGQLDARRGCQLDHGVGQTGLGVEQDKIATLRSSPPAQWLVVDRLARETGFQLLQHDVEFWLQNGAMALHQRAQAVHVLEEADVAELVDLVRA